MCFSLATSVAFSVAGGGLTAYAFYSPTVRPTGFAYLVLFYTGMEVLQTLQYHDLNRCGQLTNRALTEVGFVLVLVQPLMWNAFFRRNVELAVRPAFTLAMILSLIWMCGFSMRRFVGAENQNFEIGVLRRGGPGRVHANVADGLPLRMDVAAGLDERPRGQLAVLPVRMVRPRRRILQHARTPLPASVAGRPVRVHALGGTDHVVRGIQELPSRDSQHVVPVFDPQPLRAALACGLQRLLATKPAGGTVKYS